MRLSGRLILVSVGLVCFTAAGVGAFSQWKLEKELVPASLNRIRTEAVNLVRQAGAYVESVGADVLVLRGAAETDGIVLARRGNGVTPGYSRSEAAHRAALAQLFVSFLTAHPQYLQVRLIGMEGDGREIVRVDRAAADDTPHIVPEAGLQAKGDRTYVRAALVAAPGAIYVSPVELNMEFGALEVPHVPVVRVATPVHDAAGRPFGILIINVDMRPLFARLRAAVASPQILYVVNAEGEFLVHPDSGKTFGFDRGHRFRIRDSFPALARLAELDPPVVRELRDASGGAYWVAIAAAPTELGRRVYMIVTAPTQLIMASIATVRWSSLSMAVAVSVVAIAIAVWFARSMSRPIRQIVASLDAAGGAGIADLPTGGGTEVGILADTIQRFADREHFYRAVLESANDVIITRSLDGIITSWNPAAENLYGYTAEEAIGKPIDIIVPEEKRGEILGLYGRIEEGKTSYNIQTVRQARGGRQVDVSLTVSPLRNSAGAIIGASAIARDMSDQLRLQEMVKLAVEACPAGMIVVDDGGRIELANEAAERMFGYEPDALLGQPIDLLVPRPVRERHVVNRETYQRHPEGRAMGAGRDLRALRRDGSEFPVEVGLNPLPAAGELRVLAVVVDITERRRAEADLRDRTKELERSNAELAQFAYVASHDLQEPLRMVASFCELLKQTNSDRLDSEGLECIEFAVDGAHRMQQLINDLLAYSRLNTRPPLPARVSCADALENVRLNLHALIEESGASIESDDLPEVLCDRTQIEQLLQNLLANAIKFRSSAPPLIRIAAESDGPFWRIRVRDNGIGIDPRHYERIFGVFQRLHTREEYPGTGIGLAVCKRIVERLGGAIWVEPGEGRGTAFCFTLPAAKGCVDGD